MTTWAGLEFKYVCEPEQVFITWLSLPCIGRLEYVEGLDKDGLLKALA